MEFPNKIYTENKGEIFEHDFVKTVYDEDVDVLEIYYTDDKVIHIGRHSEGINEFDFEISLYIRDYFSNKDKLIASKIEQYKRFIEHDKKSLSKNVERLNKLTNGTAQNNLS